MNPRPWLMVVILTSTTALPAVSGDSVPGDREASGLGTTKLQAIEVCKPAGERAYLMYHCDAMPVNEPPPGFTIVPGLSGLLGPARTPSARFRQDGRSGDGHS